ASALFRTSVSSRSGSMSPSLETRIELGPRPYCLQAPRWTLGYTCKPVGDNGRRGWPPSTEIAISVCPLDERVASCAELWKDVVPGDRPPFSPLPSGVADAKERRPEQGWGALPP